MTNKRNSSRFAAIKEMITVKAVEMLKRNKEVSMRGLGKDCDMAAPSLYYYFGPKRKVGILEEAMKRMLKESEKSGFVPYFRQYHAALSSFTKEGVDFDEPVHIASAAMILAGCIDTEIRNEIKHYGMIGL